MTTTQTSTTYRTSTAATVDTKTLARSTAQSKKKPTWKWSGEDTPFEHRRWDDDEDTITLTRDERKQIDWYHTQAKVEWHNADEDEERDKKSNISAFGLCCTCKKKLNDRADFVCNTQQKSGGGFYRICVTCYEDYSKPWYLAEKEQQPKP